MADIPVNVTGTDKTKGAFASAKKGIADLGKAARDAQGGFGTLGKGAQSMQGALGGANSAVKMLTGGVAGLAAALGAGAILAGAKQLYELGAQAASLRSLRSAFDDLAASVGQSSSAMLASLRQASQGMIADQDLILAANRAIMLGVADTAEEMQDLMQVALSRGQAMGMSATDAFNDLVTGLGRMSPMILDNLGIVANAERAYATYAESIGKASEQLTDAERKQALVNDVLSANTAALAKDNPFAQLAAAGTNLKDLLGQVLLPGVEAFAASSLSFLEPVIERIERINRNLENERKNQAKQDMFTTGDSIAKMVAELNSATARQSLDLFKGIAPSPETLNSIEMLQTGLEGLAERYNEAARVAGTPLIDTSLLSMGIVAYEDATTAAEDLAAAQPAIGAAAQQAGQVVAKTYNDIQRVANGVVNDLLATMGGPAVLLAGDLQTKYQTMFNTLTQYGYTAEQALIMIGLQAQEDVTYFENLALASEQLGLALAEGIAWGAEQAAGSIAAFVGYAGSALSSVTGWLGSIARGGRTQGASTPGKGKGSFGGLGSGGIGGLVGAGNSWGMGEAPKGGTSPLGAPLAPGGMDWAAIAPSINDLGSAAGGAASSLSDFDNSLRGMLQKVPGLFGTSDVTAEQMQQADMGIPQNFADNYLRRLSDEVLNGVDWEGVDIGDAAARAGIDPNLPAEQILKMFKQSWQDSSLFADPANLELIDKEAVADALQQQQDSEAGKLNIMSFFGIDTAEQQAELAALGIQIRDGIVGGVGDPEGMTDAAGPYINNIGAQLDSKDAVDSQLDLGRKIAERVNAGFAAAAAGLPWGPPPSGGSWTPPSGGGDGRTPPPTGGTGGTGGLGGAAGVKTMVNITATGNIGLAQIRNIVRNAIRENVR